MKVGDIVVCKNKKEAVLIDVNEEWATVVFLSPGMYKPETFQIKDLELLSETR